MHDLLLVGRGQRLPICGAVFSWSRASTNAVPDEQRALQSPLAVIQTPGHLQQTSRQGPRQGHPDLPEGLHSDSAIGRKNAPSTLPVTLP